MNFPIVQKQIRDRIVVGVRDQTVSREMQKMEVDHLSEAKAVSMVRQAEEVDRQMRELNVHTQVDAVRTRSRHVKATAQSRTQSAKGCTRCGRVKHTQGQCPAMERKCRSCGHIGHYAVCCRSKTHTRNHQSKASVNVGNVDEDNISFLGEISGNMNSWTELVQVPGMRLAVMFKLDTGADVSVVPSRLCKGVTLVPNTKRLIGPGDTHIPVIGQFESVLKVGSCEHRECMYVVDQTNALLSRNACVKLGLISYHVNGVNKHEFMEEFKPLFEGLGQMRAEYEVKLQPDAHPFAIFTPRKVPYPLVDKVKEELDRMVAENVIFAVDQPTEWCAPMVVVPKGTNGEKVRICVDYTELNKVIR